MENSLILALYAIYAPITLSLTFFVAKMLFKNTKVFMLEIFAGKDEIALATNTLFEIGFYLLNLGFALLLMPDRPHRFMSYQQVVEGLSYKVGGFSIYLGVLLMINLLILFKSRRKALERIA